MEMATRKKLTNNLRISLSTALICCLSLCCLNLGAQETKYSRDVIPNYRTDVIPVIKKDTPLFNYSTEGAIEQIKMTGIYNERSFRFYSTKNEVISKASVTVRYTPSPALIPQQSQLNVYLNGQLQKSLPITKEQLGKQVSETVEFNPKQIEDSNRITLEFVGQYTTVCGTIANPALWLTVDKSSYLTLNTQKIRLANDLSLFPIPFINTQNPSSTSLPIVFANKPSDLMKTAAAVFASMGGVKAQWRGIEYPVYINEQPSEQNYVVFATNLDRPEVLKNLPKVQAPTISIIDAPNSLYAKILVISGRDEADLITATRWLATADKGLAGDTVSIVGFKALPDRLPYDAPDWIRTDKKVSFDQIAKYKGQLTSSGFHPAPIKLELKLPPDLFMVNQSNVNLDLRYRYTKPTTGEPAQMRFLLNDHLVESYDLSPKSTSSSFNSQFSLLNGLANLWNGTSIPSDMLSPENMLTFDFQYGLAVAGGSPENCKSVALIPNQVEVDPNSTIDFSGFYHFAKLPDLKLFTVSGFPFTKYADLSQTLVLIEENAPANVLSTLFTALGRLSAQTGYPATKVTVASSVSKDNAKDKDILVIAETDRKIGTMDKADPLIILDALRQKLKSTFSPDADKVAYSTYAEDTGIAAMVQYESPYSSERSIVGLFGDGQDGSFLLNKRLMNPGDLKQIGGAVAIIKPNAEPASYMVGETYFSGSLPWHQRIWYSLLDQPLLLVLFSLICALLIAGGVFYIMHSVIRLRSRRH